MNDLNKISIFRNYFDPFPALDMELKFFCENVQNGDYKIEINELRKETDKKQRDAIKAKLPAVTISGIFSQRKKENLKVHSGFICIDIDSQHNPQIEDWPALRDTLAGINNVYFSALSVSGQGVFLIIPLSTPDQHENHFKALEIDFKSIGLTIDTACKDVSRLRGMSYDSDAVINPNAKTYRRSYQFAQPKKYSHSTSPKIDNLIKWAKTKAPFVNGQRHEFIKLLAGACHRFEIDEHTAYSELLKYQQPDFKSSEIEAIIKFMYSNKTYKNLAV